MVRHVKSLLVPGEPCVSLLEATVVIMGQISIEGTVILFRGHHIHIDLIDFQNLTLELLFC